MTEPTLTLTDRIAKLPTWVQEHIKDIQRQRDVAVRALNEWTDAQTHSPISVDGHECTGEKAGPVTRTRFIQGRRVNFNWSGVYLSVMLYDEEGIQLQWGDGLKIGRDVAFIPQTYQTAILKHPKNMRQ